MAHQQVNGRIEDVQVSALAEGDRILIRPGEQVPIDGEVIEGTSSVNEAFLTGESRPVVKKTSDEVVAGAVNGEGALTIKVIRTGDKTTLSQIMRLVEEAQASKSQYQTLADRLAYWLTLIAIGVSTLQFPPALRSGLQASESRGESAIVLMDDKQVLAIFGLADQIRPSARAAVAKLQQMGVEVVMITGDAEAVAKNRCRGFEDRSLLRSCLTAR